MVAAGAAEQLHQPFHLRRQVSRFSGGRQEDAEHERGDAVCCWCCRLNRQLNVNTALVLERRVIISRKAAW